MSREAGGTAVLLVGLLLVRLTVADVYQRYVRVGMGPWLLAAGVLLIGLGAVTVARALRRTAPAALGADHHHSDRIDWLLLGAGDRSGPPGVGQRFLAHRDRNVPRRRPGRRTRA